MAFRIGQKVVHVAGLKVSRKLGNLKWPDQLVGGAVLTIRDIDRRYLNQYGVCGLRFEEYHYPTQLCGWGYIEPAFPADRFRPVVEKSTDAGMAILREILHRETITDEPPIKRKVRAV